MDEVLTEILKLRSDLRICQARLDGKTMAADYFLGQFLRERRRLTMVRKALAAVTSERFDLERAIEELE
jgi:hypothetical protein